MGDVGNHQLRYKSNRQNLVIRLFAVTCHKRQFFLDKWKDLSHITSHIFTIYWLNVQIWCMNGLF